MTDPSALPLFKRPFYLEENSATGLHLTHVVGVENPEEPIKLATNLPPITI